MTIQTNIANSLTTEILPVVLARPVLSAPRHGVIDPPVFAHLCPWCNQVHLITEELTLFPFATACKLRPVVVKLGSAVFVGEQLLKPDKQDPPRQCARPSVPRRDEGWSQIALGGSPADQRAGEVTGARGDGVRRVQQIQGTARRRRDDQGLAHRHQHRVPPGLARSSIHRYTFCSNTSHCIVASASAGT